MGAVGENGAALRRILFRPALIPAALALLVILAAGLYADHQNGILYEHRTRAEVFGHLSVIRARLEGNINGNIQLVRGLISTISTEPEMDQERFSALAESLFRERTQLRNIAVAPDLVVSMVYPLEGNSAAIGLDYRTNAQQRDLALRARDRGELVFAGPVDLVQGGKGFIARFPVFTGKSDRSFWGLVSAVVDEERLYADSGLLAADLPIEVAISGRDASGTQGEPFFGSRRVGLDNPVSVRVPVPHGYWHIEARPRGGWSRTADNAPLVRFLIVLAGCLVVVPMFFAGRLLEERTKHIRSLRDRERELDTLSRRLGLALDTSKVGVWDYDIFTRELVWDDRMNELYGLPADKGKRDYTHWRDAVHPEDRARAIAEFAKACDTRGRYHSDYRIVTPEGTVRHIRAIGAVYTDLGAALRIVGVNWDVSADVARSEELQRAHRATEGRNRDLEAAKARIEFNALHDSLTGLPNRRFLDEHLERQCAARRAGGESIALLHLDLDRFKQINDTLGHAAGDAMLVHVAAVLNRTAGPGNFVARIGGDEFVCLTRGSSTELAQLAQSLVQQMREPVTYQGQQCRSSISVGIATAAGADIDAKRLLINADIALYRAKSRGRNRYEFFTAALQAEIVTHKQIADDILSGLERNEFLPYFQPQVDARTQELVGVEALARWRHPRAGLLTPDKFLAIAEELNVVAAIDKLILERALACDVEWRATGIHVPHLSVNVSLGRLQDEDLIGGLSHLDLSAGRVSFELVESIFLDESDETVGWNIDRLKDLGIEIEIDDFGTGYASIVSLLRLKPNRLKIARQLISPIEDSAVQQNLVRSIIEIGRSLGIEAVAEGVETMSQARILADLGCATLQGYAFARPMPDADFRLFAQGRGLRNAG